MRFLRISMTEFGSSATRSIVGSEYSVVFVFKNPYDLNALMYEESVKLLMILKNITIYPNKQIQIKLQFSNPLSSLECTRLLIHVFCITDKTTCGQKTT